MVSFEVPTGSRGEGQPEHGQKNCRGFWHSRRCSEAIRERSTGGCPGDAAINREIVCDAEANSRTEAPGILILSSVHCSQSSRNAGTPGHPVRSERTAQTEVLQPCHRTVTGGGRVRKGEGGTGVHVPGDLIRK